MKIKIKSYWPAIVWMILSTVAFCLPGSVLPKDNWLGKINADKWIHIGIFTIMVFLWCVPLLHRSAQKPLIRLFILITFALFGFGVLIELVQHFFISNRSFDWGDIGADTVGCLIGFFFSQRQWKTTLN